MVNHERRVFLTNLNKLKPKSFAFTKFHLINEIFGDKDFGNVTTYEQFLALCGQLNREYVDLIQYKNILAKVNFEKLTKDYKISSL